MSGHSKWATTHRAKEVKDAKKGAAFTKLAALISVAVRQGGGIGDPEKNFRLRLVIDKAREVNMPKENISRAIEKGMGVGGGAELVEIMYEGFLPGGAAVIIEALTDNKARTAQLVRSVLEMGGGTLAGSGSVSYMFSSVGELVVDMTGKNQEETELLIIDLGAKDFELEETSLIIYCDKDKTYIIKDALEKQGYKVTAAELVMKPETVVEITNPDVKDQIEGILEKLEELDDVSKVWANYA